MLDTAARFVKPGGRIVYVTCSLLRDENEDRIAAFLTRHEDFAAISAQEVVEAAELPQLVEFAQGDGPATFAADRRHGRIFYASLRRES